MKIMSGFIAGMAMIAGGHIIKKDTLQRFSEILTGTGFAVLFTTVFCMSVVFNYSSATCITLGAIILTAAYIYADKNKTLSMPIIALANLSDWYIDQLDKKFSAALLDETGDLKVSPEEFLNHVPKRYRNLASALIGAMVAAAHNSTLLIIDVGVVEMIARYLEKICPQIKPFLLYSSKLLNFDFSAGIKIGFDAEMACMGMEIVEAALTALNEMKTFSETNVETAVE